MCDTAFVEIYVNAESCHSRFKRAEHKRRNLFNIGFFELMEHDYFINSVEQFGTEHIFKLAQNFFFNFVVAFLFFRLVAESERFIFACDKARADIRCHNYNGIFKVDFSALRVGNSALVENLQKNVENVGVRFFDFIKKHYRIRFSPYFFGELTALLKAYISRRRTDEFRHVEFVHIFAHINPDNRVFVAEHRLGKRFAKLGFAYAGRS